MTDKKQLDWTDIKIMVDGIEVTPVTFIVYKPRKRYDFEGMEYYHRRGNHYYFRNKLGDRLMVKSNSNIHDHIKYGQVMDMDFSEPLGDNENSEDGDIKI